MTKSSKLINNDRPEEKTGSIMKSPPCYSQLATAFTTMPPSSPCYHDCNSPALSGRGDGESEDAVGVAVTVAVVHVLSAITRGPDEDGAPAIPALKPSHVPLTRVSWFGGQLLKADFQSVTSVGIRVDQLWI